MVARASEVAEKLARRRFRLLRIPPVAPVGTKMGRVSYRSPNRRELRARQNTKRTPLRLRRSVYKISETGLGHGPDGLERGPAHTEPRL
jgi:hypothetical protein